MIATSTNYHCPTLPYPKIRRKEALRKKVGVIGSNGMDTALWRWFYKCMDRVTFTLDDPVILVNETPLVVDKFVKMWACKNWLVQNVYHSERKKSLQLILRDCDYLVAFWNGYCSVTDSVVSCAKDAGKPTKVFEF